MNDTPPYSEQSTSPPSSPVDAAKTVDPKLLARALKVMRGLVAGNGLKPEEVNLIPPKSDDKDPVTLYRFRARSFLKIAPEISVKREPGRNTKAEAVTTQNDFNALIPKVIAAARANPLDRKKIIDFVLSRPDKGFGMENQKIRIQSLHRDFVLHEKCSPCGNTGKTVCIKCHGHRTMNCNNCQGRKQVVCPRCRGTTRVMMNGKQQPCTHCRSDGKIICPRCSGRGQLNCSGCAATGTNKCQSCAATGWLSNLAHVEFYVKTFFDYDRIVLPPDLVKILDVNNARAVVKHDIEVALKDGWTGQQKHNMAQTQAIHTTQGSGKPTEQEPDDMIWLDYEALCPYGTLAFSVKNRVMIGKLFGFQARLMGFPPFLDDATRVGQQALIEAGKGGRLVIQHLRKAARFAVIRDIIAQTLIQKKMAQTQKTIMAKYTTGYRRDRFPALMTAADMALRHITRLWRIIGFSIGMAIFLLLVVGYFLWGERAMLLQAGLPEMALWAVDILLIPLGLLMGVYGGKFSAVLSQRRALKGIVPRNILDTSLPKAGKTVYWGAALSLTIIILVLAIGWITNTPLPTWLDGLALYKQH